jgi:hypothetical protein
MDIARSAESAVPPFRHLKFLMPLGMLYITVALADISLVYRLAKVGTLTVTAGVFVMPLYYFIEDMVTEIYGYRYFRQLVWVALGCGFVFSAIITFANTLPVPDSWHYKDDYIIVFSHLFRTMFGGGCIAVTIGAFVNSYIISKWKILIRGKYFWMRSIGSSIIGQGIQIVVGSLLLYTGIFPLSVIVDMVLPVYILQIVLSVLVATIGTFFVRILKVFEGVDAYDYSTNFNPFKFSVKG